MPRRRPARAAAATVDAESPPGTRTVGVQTEQVLPNPPEFRPLAEVPNAAGPLGEHPLEGYDESARSLTWRARAVEATRWPAAVDRRARSAIMRGIAAQVQPALLDYQQFRALVTDWVLDFQQWMALVLLQNVSETHMGMQNEAARGRMQAADIDQLRRRVAEADLRIAGLQAWRAQVAGRMDAAAPRGSGTPDAAAERTMAPAVPRGSGTPGAAVNIVEAVQMAQRAAHRSRPPSPLRRGP